MAVTKVVELPVNQVVSSLWWILMTQAVFAILFGIIAIFWPRETLVILVYLFSIYVLLWGIFELIHGLMSITHRSTWWLSAVLGLGGLGVGVYMVRHPRESFTTLILLIGLTFIVRGILAVVGGFLDQLSVTQRSLTILAGIVAVVAGIIILLQPAAGGIAFVWIVGLYALIYGALMFALAIEGHNIHTALLLEEK